MLVTLIDGDHINFYYTNHAGKRELRAVIFKALEFGTVENYYKKPTLLLRGFDLKRSAIRSFDVSKIEVDTLLRIEPPAKPNHPTERKGTGEFLRALSNDVYLDNVAYGWYTDLQTGEHRPRPVPEAIALIHSEVSEAFEGARKNLMDDKLPHRSMLEVELADVLVRVFDLAGAEKLDIGGAYVEKRRYNHTRADHKRETRLLPGGKSI
jgi:NTP pyrophosphatase (non-canonical NTP hydrolase)